MADSEYRQRQARHTLTDPILNVLDSLYWVGMFFSGNKYVLAERENMIREAKEDILKELSK